MKEELLALKSNVKLQAWSNLITMLFTRTEQDRIIALLQDPTKKIRFEMHIVEDLCAQTANAEDTWFVNTHGFIEHGVDSMEFKHAQSDIISILHTLNDQLGVARNSYLRKEAEKDHFEAVMISQSAGKSVAERVINAKAKVEWNQFQIELARLEAVYEFMRMKFRVVENEYQSQYLETKLNDGLTKRGGG